MIGRRSRTLEIGLALAALVALGVVAIPILLIRPFSLNSGAEVGH